MRTYDPTQYNHVFVRQWDDGDHYDLVAVCREIAELEEKYIIHIISLEEGMPSGYSHWLGLDDNPDADKYLQQIQDKDIHVEVYVGAHQNGYDEHFGIHSLNRYKNHKVRHDPSFFIKNSFANLSEHSYARPMKKCSTTKYLNRLIRPIGNTTFIKLFMSLNGAPRYHRMLLLNSIYDSKLWDKGYITWFGVSDNYRSRQERSNAAYKEKILMNSKFTRWGMDLHTLPSQAFKKSTVEDITDPNQFQDLYPLEARNCVLHVIGETDVDIFFLTEKTAIPLILGKPVLVLSCKGFHTQYMTAMGFALHDNVIDYSFDKEDSLRKRVDGIIDNLNRLQADYGHRYEELYRLMYPVAAHNSKNVVDLVRYRWSGVTERAMALMKFEPKKGEKYSLGDLKERFGNTNVKLFQDTYMDLYRRIIPDGLSLSKKMINYNGHFPIRLSQ